MDFSNQLILKDFDIFLDFLNENAPLELTNDKGVLKAKYLLRLNAKMQSFQTKFASDRHKQDVFTLIQTFFFITEKAQFVIKKTDLKTQKNTLHLNIERAKLYDALTDNEKYFFLLDTFWAHLNWEYAYDCRTFWGKDFYLKLVSDFPLGKKITIEDVEIKRKGEIRGDYNSFLAEILSAFGFYELEWDTNLIKRQTKYAFPYQTVAVTPLGKEIIPILFGMEGLKMRSNFSFVSLLLEDEDEDETLKIPILSDLFKEQFSDWKIENKLLPIDYELVNGIYHLKIALDKNCYRVIEIGGNDSFDDLHDAIQEAFDFDDDHLYVFFMDNRRWSSEEESCFWSPHYQDIGIFADEKLIGQVGLIEGRKFMYLFDFGDEWIFEITVERILTDKKEPEEVSLILSKGEAPKQYN